MNAYMQLFPAEFVHQAVRDHHADLASFNDAQIAAHYDAYGRSEGRVTSYPALREHFLPLASGDILEIGPFNNPAYEGTNVRYLDVLDAVELRKRAREINLDTSRCPQVVHYQSMEAVDAKFDVVFSSHNIEHQPDLIGHLKHVHRVLRPGGVFMAMIPDHRYCFDHFLEPSTLADVLEGQGRTVHTTRNVVNHFAYTSHNDTLAYWRKEPGPRPNPMERIGLARDALEKANGDYIDVHAWQFTPDSFRSLISQLVELGLSPLKPLRTYQTPYGRHEFAAVLSF